MTRSPWKWIIFGCLLVGVLAFGFDARTQGPATERNGGVQVAEGQGVFATPAKGLNLWLKLTDARIASGELRLALAQTEDDLGLLHERYDQYYHGVKVWGAQIIRHERQGEVYLVNGTTHEGIFVDVTPAFTAQEAEVLALKSLPFPDFNRVGQGELLIYPATNGPHLAFKFTHTLADSEMITFIDAHTGGLLNQFDNAKTEAQIGIGRGVHGDSKKLSTSKEADGKYYTYDLMRPAKLRSYSSNYTTLTNTVWYCTDTDNNWDHDPALVDAHAYLGYVYDYYYLVFGRKSIDNGNKALFCTVHYGNKYTNAFYLYSTNGFYFGDGDPSGYYPLCTALDVFAHEFTHGVTDFTSSLIYQFDSGALNEAFSDIMGASCEFFHQEAGSGYRKAEWWMGEDIYKSFQAMRDLSDPARISFSSPWGTLKYPDHMTKKYDFSSSFDQGGVHINSSIANNWYYLLANGGTNKTSGRSVTGIGVGDAQKIAYRTWTYYLGPSSGFAAARSASYQAAIDLFGTSSTQAQRVAQAWDAVGVY